MQTFTLQVPKNDAVVDRGSIQLSIRYSTEQKGLVVTVLRAVNIAELLPKGECEAFVKWYVCDCD